MSSIVVKNRISTTGYCKSAMSFTVSLHETIFPLFGEQFNRLFAETLQNCIWKLISRKFVFDF